MQDKIVIAHIIGKWLGGGVESFVMNYYRNINRDKIQFHFICDRDSTNIPYEEIEMLGGRVILIPPYQKIFNYIKELRKIFRENKYRIVHSHLNSLNVFPLFCAYKENVCVRIAHSHSTTNKKEWKKNIIKNVLKRFSKIFATDYFACTEYAGKWLFGDKQENIKLVNNSINIEMFKFNDEIRNKIKKELNIEDKFVVGHGGRVVQQKNHDFLLDIFNEIYKNDKNAILLLIGEGPLEKDIKKKINDLKLNDVVYFLGIRKNVNELMQAMDVFVFPSLYEGLGMVLIEAQASGLKCVCSTEVPIEAKLTENITFLNLDDGVEKWYENIIAEKNTRKSYVEELRMCGYDIKNEVKKLENDYLELWRKYENCSNNVNL